MRAVTGKTIGYSCAMLPYTHRRTWPDDREDYILRCEGLDVGRVYRTELPDGEFFVWSIYINGHVPQVEGVPIEGRAATLGLAGVDFKRSYERMREAAGLPKPGDDPP